MLLEFRLLGRYEETGPVPAGRMPPRLSRSPRRTKGVALTHAGHGQRLRDAMVAARGLSHAGADEAARAGSTALQVCSHEPGSFTNSIPSSPDARRSKV